MFVTNGLSGFEISLMCMPCKASQHSYDVWSVARGFQMQAVRCYLDGTCTRLQIGAEFGPLPQQDQASAVKVFLHTCSMTVFQHALKASTPGGAQFDSFILSQRPSPQQELHEWGQSSPHSYRWRLPGASKNRLPTVKMAHFVAGEYGGAFLRIYGAAVGPRGRTSRV
jgi:hypothetical protein